MYGLWKIRGGGGREEGEKGKFHGTELRTRLRTSHCNRSTRQSSPHPECRLDVCPSLEVLRYLFVDKFALSREHFFQVPITCVNTKTRQTQVFDNQNTSVPHRNTRSSLATAIIPGKEGRMPDTRPELRRGRGSMLTPERFTYIYIYINMFVHVHSASL